MMKENESPDRQLAGEFERRIAAAERMLDRVTEVQAAGKSGDGWIPKEILGHLLNSAAHNHMRFAYTALLGEWAGPGYDQRAWVDLHGFRDQAWCDLLDEWRTRNRALARVVSRIPERALSGACRIGNAQAVTLRFLIQDYLRHLDHHVEQILAGLG